MPTRTPTPLTNARARELRGDLVSRAFEDQWSELHDVPLEVTGRIPEGLSGTLYRNSPTAFQWPGGTYQHWFDGHGQVHALTLGAAGVRYSNRFIQTAALKADRRSGGIGGAFGTPIPGGLVGLMRGALETRANINLVKVGDRLLALQEGDVPYALDMDLETLGPDRLGFLGPREGYTAHPHWDPERRVLVSASQAYPALRMDRLDVTAMEADGRLAQRFSVRLPYAPLMVHDFGLTQKHLVLPVYPLFADFFQFLTGRSTLGYDAVWRPERGAFLTVTDRDGGDRRNIEIPPMFSYHVANCYDDRDTLVVDLMAYDSGEVVKWTGLVPWQGFVNPFLPQIRRLRAYRDGRVEVSSFNDLALEFGTPHPRWYGRPYRYCYPTGATRTGLRSEADIVWQAARLDVESGECVGWHAPLGHMLSESTVVPKSDTGAEEDVWLLMVAYDPFAHRSRLVILDGARLEEGPVAEAPLPQHMPPSVHGCFVPA